MSNLTTLIPPQSFPHPATIPVPVVTTLSAIAHFSRFARLSPVGLMSSIVLDSTLNVAKLAYQYYQATQNADSKAEILAKNIAILRGWNPKLSSDNDNGNYRGQKSLDKKRKSHSKPGESLDKPRSFVYDKIRVVSHSLGCRHLLSALSILMSSEFLNSQTSETSSTLNYLPTSIHLCAAALTESDALPTLTKLCRHNVNVYIYFTEKDTVLSTMFRVMAKGEKAIGEVGLSEETVKYLQTLQTDSSEFHRARLPKLEGDFKNKKRKIKLVDVTGYFDRAIDKVHTGYANRFHRFAASDSYHIDHSHVQI
ncbi:hypothetical protein BKA69DRAFT_774268 [Paraphysoderma sedebokerense]|nr:hypothetical protein BKA69DRAFT_774268 [Paraphysoderma sedebokerense]